MAFERRDISGNAVATTLAAGITDSATTFTITSATGWPTGSAGDFLARNENETIRCASRSGTTVTVATSGRGYEGTTAVAHLAGSEVTHIVGKTDLDEANAAVYELLGTGSAWTPYTPTLTNITIGNGSVGGRSRPLGKSIEVVAWVSCGSSTAFTASAAAISLPVSAKATAPIVDLASFFYDLSAARSTAGAGYVFTGTDASVAVIYTPSGSGDTFAPLTTGVFDPTPAAGDTLVLHGTYEAA